MSWGGSVAAMISSLKNNRLALSSNRERRKRAMAHHAEKKIRENLKDKEYDPKIIQQIREEAEIEFKAELRIQKVVILGIIMAAIIFFSWLFSFLKVV